MRYTPVELRHAKPGRGLFGYKRAEVDRLVQDVADSFEEVWGERGELADRLEDLEKRLEEVKQRETLLASTLVAAEKTAVEQIESAKREAEVIVAEAHQESRSITRAAQAERERLFAEVRRVETLLRAALGMVEESRRDPLRPNEPADSWPNRENTSEFKAVEAPQPQEPKAEEPPAPEPLPEQPAPEATPLPPVQETPDAPSDPPRDFAWG
ncbi:MAG TPA: DivIVA domain-containing protein [Gaiellaceae bacterium]|jgi:cell division initiation protein|nr:DivIVA domain-containing protein [Gaiellaceae bacterium]